jgi:hypothetical protein
MTERQVIDYTKKETSHSWSGSSFFKIKPIPKKSSSITKLKDAEKLPSAESSDSFSSASQFQSNSNHRETIREIFLDLFQEKS